MQLSEISALRIPRCSAPVNVQIVDRQLINCFSDASEKANCFVLYVTSIDTAGSVYMSLALGKTRVAPLKKVTLPRLLRSSFVRATYEASSRNPVHSYM